MEPTPFPGDTWKPWIHGLWMDLTLLSHSLGLLQQRLLWPTPMMAPSAPSPREGAAGNADWLLAYA